MIWFLKEVLRPAAIATAIFLVIAGSLNVGLAGVMILAVTMLSAALLVEAALWLIRSITKETGG